MTTEVPPLPAEPLTFTCPSCGAQTAYAPGTTVTRCPSCGAEQHIETAGLTVVEHSYDDWVAQAAKPVAMIGKQALRCQNCGATTETDLVADSCQFCGGVLIALQNPDGLIAPEAVVPFAIDKGAANEAFTSWVRSRRFAPSALKKVGSTEAIKGTYIPHWTYDAQSEADYTGQRGEHYWVTETYQVSDGKGGTRTETRQVQHTRWYDASGRVQRFFDDVLVPASHHLPTARLQKMGPWSLQAAAAYQPQYLAGYSALRYDVDPDVGLTAAQSEMADVLTQDCRGDIGGDEQRVLSMNVRYAETMFKLILLPLWIASYLYAGQTFQVLVNANTGEVVGDRPYSKIKIAVAVVVALLVTAAVIAVIVATKSHHSATVQ
jgi:transcription elongation factor Elf1